MEYFFPYLAQVKVGDFGRYLNNPTKSDDKKSPWNRYGTAHAQLFRVLLNFKRTQHKKRKKRQTIISIQCKFENIWLKNLDNLNNIT